MIGRFGGGPVKETPEEMLVLVFLIFIPLGIAFTSGGPLGVGVYYALLIVPAVGYSLLTKYRRVTFDNFLIYSQHHNLSKIRYSGVSYERGEFTISKVEVFSTVVNIYYKKYGQAGEYKESISRKGCVSIYRRGINWTIKFRESVDSPTKIQVRIW